MKELKDTIILMNSSDYKDRFKAEYYQVKIRYNKLQDMINKWDNGLLNFTPTCPREIYNDQLKSMFNYLSILESRGIIENINISE